MLLADALETALAVVRDDLFLDLIEIGGDETEPFYAGGLENLVQGKYRRVCGDTGAFLDFVTQLLVGVESEPSRGSAVPGNDVDLGVGEKFGRFHEGLVIELAERALAHGDLGHPESSEVGRDIRNSGQDRTGHGLQDSVGRRGQHPQENTLAHSVLPPFSTGPGSPSL